MIKIYHIPFITGQHHPSPEIKKTTRVSITAHVLKNFVSHLAPDATWQSALEPAQAFHQRCRGCDDFFPEQKNQQKQKNSSTTTQNYIDIV